MKLEFVNGFLPMLIFKANSERKVRTYFFLSFMKNPDDPIMLGHEKVIVKHNYLVTITSIIYLMLALVVNYYVFLFSIVLLIPILTILYWSNVGEYHRDVKAYAMSARLKSDIEHMDLDEAFKFYKDEMVASKKYGDFVEKIGDERIIHDLKQSL